MAEEYVVLIVEPGWNPEQIGEEQWTEMTRAHQRFAKAVEDAGARILGGDALQPPRAAVRIDPGRDGRPAVFTDGPFGEFDEVVSGYYKLGVADAAQARELAALVPTAGHIELYPVMDTGSA